MIVDNSYHRMMLNSSSTITFLRKTNVTRKENKQGESVKYTLTCLIDHMTVESLKANVIFIKLNGIISDHELGMPTFIHFLLATGAL